MVRPERRSAARPGSPAPDRRSRRGGRGGRARHLRAEVGRSRRANGRLSGRKVCRWNARTSPSSERVSSTSVLPDRRRVAKFGDVPHEPARPQHGSPRRVRPEEGVHPARRRAALRRHGRTEAHLAARPGRERPSREGCRDRRRVARARRCRESGCREKPRPVRTVSSSREQRRGSPHARGSDAAAAAKTTAFRLARRHVPPRTGG